VHAYLAPDALRVLTGEGRAAVGADDALQVTGPRRRTSRSGRPGGAAGWGGG